MATKQERKDWESWIDEQVREAEERGQFENLPGRGKPLDLASNPHAGDREMAYKILHEAGYAPEWIELDKAIRARLERARTTLARAWAYYCEAADGPTDRPESEGASPFRPGSRRLRSERERAVALGAWQASVERFHKEVAAINLQITELNLKVPAPRFQRTKVDAAREVRRLEEGAA